MDPQELNEAWNRLVCEAVDQLTADGFQTNQMRIRRAANMHYQGQTFEPTVPVPADPLTSQPYATWLRRLPRSMSGRRDKSGGLPPRQAYFGPQIGWVATPVLHCGDLATPCEGPCIIEEYDATCIVPPKAKATLDAYGNIIIDLL